MAKKTSKGKGKGSSGRTYYRDAKGRFASKGAGSAKSSTKKKAYSAPALTKNAQPKGLKAKRSLATKAGQKRKALDSQPKKKAYTAPKLTRGPSARRLSDYRKAKSKAERTALNKKLKSVKPQNNRTPAALTRGAKRVSQAKSARNNASPFIRNPRLGGGLQDRGVNDLFRQAGFLAKGGGKFRGKNLKKEISKNKASMRRTSVQTKIAKSWANPDGRNLLSQPKPPKRRKRKPKN